MTQLQTNIHDMSSLLMTTKDQYQAIQKLAVLNGSLLMASHQVLLLATKDAEIDHVPDIDDSTDATDN